MSADWITLRSEALTARINPLGAELSSLTDRLGREWMTDADPAFWTGRSPILFPIVGALNGGTYRLGGHDYALPQHGFARRMMWHLLDAGEDRAAFELVDTPETRIVYPFAFRLRLDYRLDGTRLTLVATLTNPGAGSLPASFGYHPAFAWPLPGGMEKRDHAILFEQAEPIPLARLSQGLISGQDRPSPLVDQRLLPLSDELFASDALIWDGLASRAVTYCGPAGALRVDFPDADKLGIWSKAGARFVCIEPWWGIADPAGFTGDLHAKPGILMLDPGEQRTFAVGLTIDPQAS